MDSKPFGNFRIASADFLESSGGRSACPSCGKSRKFFCFLCSLPTACADRLPLLKLPVRVEIIKHPSEFHGKSTSCHAAILAPEAVRIHKYPAVPDLDPKKTLLVFPGPEAKTLSEWLHPAKIKDEAANKKENVAGETMQNEDEEEGKRTSAEEEKEENGSEDDKEPPQKRRRSDPPQFWFDTVVLLDCTWNQTGALSKDERLKDLSCVVLKEHHSLFWRFQRDNPPNYLSTIEAIFYFLMELHEASVGPYDRRYDNLLFYFKFLYDKLYVMYDGGKDLKAYTRRNFQLRDGND